MEPKDKEKRLVSSEQNVVTHLGDIIVAIRLKYEMYNTEKNKWEEQIKTDCLVYLGTGLQDHINLREANDGSRFNGIQHAINEGKHFIKVSQDQNRFLKNNKSKQK